MALPYTREEGLSALPEEIPLEYFEKALDWLKDQPEVDPDKIILMGASRNAEMALIIASYLPELVSGVIAYSPSAVSWANRVLPYNSDDEKPRWTFRGEDIEYIPMEKIASSNSDTIQTLTYWEKGLKNTKDVEISSIPVEKINGPILLLSGKDDNVWPSAKMADMVENRLDEKGFKFQVQNIQYDNTGHLLSSNPEMKAEPRTGIMTIQNEQFFFKYGGTDKGDYQAKQDAKERVLKFLEEL